MKGINERENIVLQGASSEASRGGSAGLLSLGTSDRTQGHGMKLQGSSDWAL